MVYLLGIPVYFIGLLILLVAGFYAIVWPKQFIDARPRPVGQRTFLRWGNALCWLFLALAFFAWGASNIPLAIVMGISGGIIYLVYIVILLGGQQRPRKKL